MSIFSEIKGTAKAGGGNALVYVALLTAAATDIIPTPADALHFWHMQKLKQQLEKKEITPRQYWLRNAAGYYLYNPVWWVLLLGTVALVKGDYTKKMKVGVAVIAAGAVVAVVAQNIKKDEKNPAYKTDKTNDNEAVKTQN